MQEGGWAPGPVWTGAENLTLIGIRFPDCLGRGELLYRLRYPRPGLYSVPVRECALRNKTACSKRMELRVVVAACGVSSLCALSPLFGLVLRLLCAPSPLFSRFLGFDFS